MPNLADLPLPLAIIVFMYWIVNQNNIKWMNERKETIEALAAEREAWNEWQRAIIERFFAQQEARAAVQERVAVALEALKTAWQTEMHSTRNTIQNMLNRYEAGAKEREAREPRTGGE